MALRKSTAPAASSSFAAVEPRNSFFAPHDLPQPGPRLVTTQSAGSFLHVRLEMVDGVPIPSQPLLRQFLELRLQKRPRLLLRSGQNFLIQPLEEFRVARQKSPVQKREMKFGVVRFDPPAFFDCASRGAYAKSQVPQGAGKFGDERAVFLLRLFAFKKKKNVEVRIRKEQPPSVSAEGDQAETMR